MWNLLNLLTNFINYFILNFEILFYRFKEITKTLCSFEFC